ncbi:MAG: hypothetical protein GSR78_03610 [Desulfurococcales archaeon]|nr:hypothetical protein [Desulfurococcales archaeon]
MVTVTLYIGFDWESRIAWRVARDVQVLLAREYGVQVDLDVVEVPVGDVDEEKQVPTIIVDGRPVSSGKVPSMAALIEAVFDAIADQVGVRGVGLPEVTADLAETGV